MPSTSYLEMAIAAGKELNGGHAWAVEEVKLLKACFMPDGQTRLLQQACCSIPTKPPLKSAAPQ